MQTYKHNLSIHQQGFTLLEVLIALLVLSIGLLGLASLQTTGLRSNQMASMRTLVSQFAYDITDRMRVNPAGVANNEYVIARATAATLSSPPTLAETDISEWRTNIARLPNGQSEITQCTPSTTPACPVVDGKTTHVVTIYWNESRDTATSTFNCPPLSSDDFRCFRMVTR
ncbi:MAG: type IV pilus modification protein PilV [Proteobacteria bacterium]|nr:type IV pilus modification protein PilV [Pseudomonadota bacterium]